MMELSCARYARKGMLGHACFGMAVDDETPSTQACPLEIFQEFGNDGQMRGYVPETIFHAASLLDIRLREAALTMPPVAMQIPVMQG